MGRQGQNDITPTKFNESPSNKFHQLRGFEELTSDEDTYLTTSPFPPYPSCKNILFFENYLLA